jgi:hypothetical protein
VGRTPMRTPAVTMLLVVALGACGTAPRTAPDAPRYIVTAAPIDTGVVSKALCIGVDPGDPRGVWWWEPGASGCGTRSTGPDVFHADRAEVVARHGSTPIAVGFRMQLKRGPASTLPAFADVHLVVEDRAIRAVASGVEVAAARRADLELSLEPARR